MEQAIGPLILLMCLVSIIVFVGAISWLVVARRTERRLDTPPETPPEGENS